MLYTPIKKFIEKLDISSVSDERKIVLQPLANYIQEKVNRQEPIRLNFICTHNSRRSHLSQIWAQTIANYFNILNITTYSGGTESTAMFPVVKDTLVATGFKINTIAATNNPIYTIKYSDNNHPIIGFSKKMDDDFNPKSEFGAILTCDSANEACPIVPGAEKRFPIMFEDPKAFDNTPQQAEKYAERSLQIATELFFVFSLIEK